MATLGAAGFIDIYFTIDGLQEVQTSFVTFGRLISSLAPAWTTVGEELLSDFAEQFIAEGGVFGGWSEWDALRDNTVRERERLGYGGEGPIEVRTGRLRSAVTEKGAAGNVFQVTPTELMVGFQDDIGSWQHYGTRRGIPPRPLVGLSQYRKSSIINTLDDFIKEQIIASGLVPD